MSYPIVGDARKFSAKFLDLSGNEVDPNTVTFEVRHPSGSVDTYDLLGITKDSVGNYSKIILFDEPGNWYIEWQGTGTVQKVANSSFYVKPQIIIPSA